jgi:NTP pyrophosphatase (non-canonical NTP hydrolase)
LPDAIGIPVFELDANRVDVVQGIPRCLEAIETELRRARIELGYGPMHSAHEGFAVLMEEVDELKAHVWMKQKNRDLKAMRKEAIEVGAMAVAFAAEVCDEERGRV